VGREWSCHQSGSAPISFPVDGDYLGACGLPIGSRRETGKQIEFMLKDRQDGLLRLHGCALMLTTVVVFLGWTATVEWTGWIRFARHFSLSLYLLGAFGGALWVYHGLKAFQNRLGNLDWIESMQVSRQQLTRIIVVLFTFAFVTKDTGVSRAFLTGYILILAVVLVAANVIYPRCIIRFFFGDSVRRTILVAPAHEVEDIAGWIKTRQHLGIEVVGWVAEGKPEDGSPLPLLGSLKELRHIVREHDISQVVVSQLHHDPRQLQAITRCGEEAGCRVRFYANYRHYFSNLPVSVEHDGDYTFIALAAEPLENPINRALKRTLDIAVALPVVVFVLPILALMVWIAQRIQAPGPLLHRQYRSGLNRRKFLIYKFRTMHVTDDGAVATQARREDARVYPFGRFLRRTSLDEIPQFLNVLWGTMSVSGPRPHLLEHDEQFAKIVNSYYTRHFVKPGITGLAQSKGLRGEISEPALLHQRIGYDMLYIRHWTLWLDVQILAATVRQMFSPPRSAY
jgi:exopolysaccharide biosynthesis polyprenyl glycosylphosphotransferase